MESLQQLLARRQTILDEAAATLKASELAKRNLSTDERARLKVIREEDDKIKAEVESLQGDQAARDWAKGLDEDLNASAGRLIKPEAAQQIAKVEEKPAFKTFGEQLQAVARAGQRGLPASAQDQRLAWESLAPSGASEGQPSDGGFLVQKDFSTELLKRTYESGEVLSRCRSIPISGNSNGLKINAVDEQSRANGSRGGGVQVYWAAEADTVTAKKPRLRQMELNLKKVIGLAYATDELIADASALEAVFMQAFSEEFSFKLEDNILNGTGAGQMLGVMNAGCLVSVSKEAGQAAATLQRENIDKMYSRMWGRSRTNAIWLYNQDCEPQLFSLTAAVGTGGLPVYLPPGGLSVAPYSTIYGRPAIPVEYCATLGTTGDILFLDLSQYLLITKGGLFSDSSVHVRFIYDEMTFRWVYRIDGQPIWNTALTPASGSSNTLSPFIALNTRA